MTPAKTWRLVDLELPLLAMGGVLLSAAFASGVYLPQRPTVIVLFAVAGWGMLSARASRLAILERLMIVLYVLPFSVTIGYLFNPDYIWVSVPVRVALLSDKVLVVQMLNTGLVGLLGLICGMKIVEMRRRAWKIAAFHRNPHLTDAETRPAKVYTLDSVQYILLLTVSMALSYAANGATHTLFTGNYHGTGRSWTAGVGFGAASLVSYLIRILLFIDAERDFLSRRRLKMFVLLAATIFGTVFFELIRGNRDAIGLVTALMALYLTGSAMAHARRSTDLLAATKRVRRMAVPGLLVGTVYFLLGRARVQLAEMGIRGLSMTDLFITGLTRNTWTLVLLTNVGLAGFYRAGTIDYLYGSTYLDYFLSLPPGIVARAVGYTRPLEHFQGPNWWFEGVASGGIHPVAVPFMNFGIFGVFFVLFLFGVFIAWADSPNASLWRRFLYAGVIAGSFKWFWYGDMTIVRALMGVGVLSMLYVMLLHITHTLTVRFARSHMKTRHGLLLGM